MTETVDINDRNSIERRSSTNPSISILIRCSICCDTIKRPKILSCFHHFCAECIENHHKETQTGNQARCPICRRPFVLDFSGAESLPTCPYAQHILDEIVRIRNDEDERRKTTKFCNALCEQENLQAIAIKNCPTCQLNLCERCGNIHSLFAKTHALISLQDTQNESDLLKRTLSQESHSTCDSHPQNNVNNLCQTCDHPICKECTSYHEGHKMITLDKVKEKTKFMKEIISNRKDELEKLKGDLNAFIIMLQTGDEKARREIKEYYEYWIKGLKDHMSLLDSDLRKKSSEAQNKVVGHLKDLDDQSIFAEHAFQAINRVIAIGNDGCTLKTWTLLEQKFEKLKRDEDSDKFLPEKFAFRFIKPPQDFKIFGKIEQAKAYFDFYGMFKSDVQFSRNNNDTEYEYQEGSSAKMNSNTPDENDTGLALDKNDAEVIKEEYSSDEDLPYCPRESQGSPGGYYSHEVEPANKGKSTEKRRMVKVLYDYEPKDTDELRLVEGHVIEVISEIDEGWWEGFRNGKRGMFPSNYVEEVDDENSNKRAETLQESRKTENLTVKCGYENENEHFTFDINAEEDGAAEATGITNTLSQSITSFPEQYDEQNEVPLLPPRTYKLQDHNFISEDEIYYTHQDTDSDPYSCIGRCSINLEVSGGTMLHNGQLFLTSYHQDKGTIIISKTSGEIVTREKAKYVWDAAAGIGEYNREQVYVTFVKPSAGRKARIDIFSRSGKCMGLFTKNVDYPLGIASSSSEVFVSDKNRLIKVFFATDGSLKYKIKNPLFRNPWSLALMNENYLLVSDFDAHCVFLICLETHNEIMKIYDKTTESDPTDFIPGKCLYRRGMCFLCDQKGAKVRVVTESGRIKTIIRDIFAGTKFIPLLLLMDAKENLVIVSKSGQVAIVEIHFELLEDYKKLCLPLC